MGDSSDGTKDILQKMKAISRGKLKETRSFSAGTVNLSAVEIENIIGISTEAERATKKADKEKNGQASNTINSEEQQNIRGSANKLNDMKDVGNPFKPTNAVMRTPPANSNAQNKIETTTKRLRSENTPEQENKRQCSKKWENIEKENVMEAKPNENVENVISKVFSSLDDIQKVEKNMRVLLEKEDCDTLSNAVSKIYKCLTLLVHRIGHLEKENIMVGIKNVEQIKEKEKQKSEGKKTYAAVSTVTRKDSEGMQVNSEQTEWSTPKISKKLETIVTINNETNSRNTLQMVKQHISTEKLGALKTVKHLKNGAIVLESHDENQREKLKNILSQKKDVLLKENVNMDPMFMITGIIKGIKDEDFLKDLILLNDDIECELGYDIGGKIKVITKKQCRNQFKENWILQAPPDIAKCFLKRQIINFDLVKVHVQEYFNLALCYNCAGFGHVAKHCKEKQCCHRCGGEHHSSECTTDSLKCPNCTKLKYNQELCHHSARDKQCPVFIKKLSQFQGQINYSSSNRSFL